MEKFGQVVMHRKTVIQADFFFTCTKKSSAIHRKAVWGKIVLKKGFESIMQIIKKGSEI
jgi:hypothetical protein